MKIVRTSAPSFPRLLAQIEQRGNAATGGVEPVVRTILDRVRRLGDLALINYARRFDGLQPSQSIRVTPAEMRAAWRATPRNLRAALATAARNIARFARAQRPAQWALSPAPGVTTGQLVRPLESVGCYVPGGRYPLPSTVLMTAIPARVAGVPRIVVCSPKPALETLAAAHLAGVTEMYRIGGAQAVAALAYGTESIAPVNKIVGPGNLYVTAAKLLVSRDCGIDMSAGPTEIVVTSDRGNPAGIAADIVAQSEHDPETLAVLITSKVALAKAVAAEVKLQATDNALARAAIAARGLIIVTRSVAESRALTNRLAPEHLTVDSAADLKWVANAGSVFVGDFSPQSMGDYVSGTNHVLPTGRTGRVRGGLSVLDFLKIITVQQYTRAGLAKLGPAAVTLATAEGLTAHANSVRIRLAAKKSRITKKGTGTKKKGGRA